MSFFKYPFYDFARDMSRTMNHLDRALTSPFVYRQVPTTAAKWASPWLTNESFFNESFTPALNVHENDKAYTLKFSAPGATKENLEIDFNKDANLLTVRGKVPEQSQEKKDKEGNVVYKEMSSGDFERSMTLPSGVDAGSIKANFKDGILTLEVPKVEKPDEAAHQKISIED